MTETDAIAPAAALAAALEELFDAYPTDEDDAPTGAVLTVTDPATGEARTIQLQAGQATWLTTLVMDEATTCRNAHSDGNGRCAHCHGSGDAFTSPENSRPLGPYDDQDFDGEVA